MSASKSSDGSQHQQQSGDWRAVHASALVLGETGVLVRGASGSGKSGLTLALLGLARDRALFASLIGDDRVLICERGGRILAKGAPNVGGLIEKRGYGIIGAPTEPCAVVRLVVDLLPPGERAERLPDESALKASLGQIALPRLAFDIETAALERAYAVLGYLDEVGDKIMTGLAHFA
jgi:HPr kinase/phosphorylase